MARNFQFTSLTKEEYVEFAKTHPYKTFLNQIEALNTSEKGGNKLALVGVREGGKIVAATPLIAYPVMRKYNYFYAQRGFLIDYRDKELFSYFMQGLRTYLKSNNALYLRVDPYIIYKERDIDGELVEGGEDNSDIIDIMTEAGFTHKGLMRGFDTKSQSRWMFSLYFNGRTADEVYKNFDEQTRWSVNKTLKQGIQVRELPIEEIDIYTKMMQETAVRRQFEARSDAFYKRFIEEYGEHARLLLAYLDLDEYDARLVAEKEKLVAEIAETEEKLLATPNNKKMKNRKRVAEEALALNEKKSAESAALRAEHGNILNMATSCFTVYDEEIVYLFSGTDDTFRKYNAPYAIHWDMIQYAIDHGINRYNFYGISGIFDKDAVDYGVYDFKRGFTGVVEELVGDFILPIAGTPFKIYDKLKGGVA